MHEKLCQIIREVFNVDQDSVDDNLRLLDLETWDSLNHMLFITRIEKEFGIELSGDDIADMQTVAQIKAILDGQR